MCDIEGNLFLFSLVAFFTVLTVFRFTCDVVDEYIAESLVYLSKVLKLSEALAGVTLLALANGAGDLLTAIVASDSAEGVSYNIGALLGAGLFVITIVLYFTINSTKKLIIIDESTVNRDVLFYIAGILLIVVCGIWGYLTWWTSVIMLFIYALLVFVVWYQDKVKA